MVTQVEMFSFSLTTAVRGFHVYKNAWEPTIGEVLSCERDVGNSHDTFAVAAKKSTEVVGNFLSSGGSFLFTIGRKYFKIPCPDILVTRLVVTHKPS